MSIIRVGLSETKNFADGYEAIFGHKAEDPKPDDAGSRAPEAADQTPAKPASEETAR